MKKAVVRIISSVAGDILFGLVAAVFVHYLAGEIVPAIFTTQLMSGAISLTFDSKLLKEIFSVWHCFCILFGIRFVVAYITGSYRTTINFHDKKFIEED